MTRFSLKDYEVNKGQRLYGRISAYDRMKGYGYIFAENGKEIFVSSYAFPGKTEDKIMVGTLLRFTPELYQEKICARDIEILDQHPHGMNFRLPNGREIQSKRIQKFGLVTAQWLIENEPLAAEAYRNGVDISKYEHVYIKTSDGLYRVFGTDSQVDADGTVEDLRQYMEYLRKTFLFLW